MKLNLLLILLLSVFFINADSSTDANKKPEKKQIIKTISSEEAYKMITQKKVASKFTIIDFRTPDEFKSAHIENSKNIDFYAKELEDILNKMDKNEKYLIYCRSGNRSGQALKIMQRLGFNEVYDFGGILSWTIKGYKTAK